MSELSHQAGNYISGQRMLSLGGQSLEDKLYAVKYFISGQGLSFVVLKATTSELIGPKKKHLSYLVDITNEPNVSIPNLAKYLMQRTQHPEWSVVFKALITINHLMNYGNEKFTQNLASSVVNHRSFDRLSSFVDRSSSQAYDMSTFVRRYSRYINKKVHTYRLLGVDFCTIKPSTLKMRSMSLERLTVILPVLQAQFDTLLAFDATARDLGNGIISSAFAALYKDFVKLFIVYQGAIIRLLELYFTVNHVKRTRELLEAYKKFLVRMEKVYDFMRVIDSVGMDKSEMPNLSLAPSLPLAALQRHLDQMESSPVGKRSLVQGSSTSQAGGGQSPASARERPAAAAAVAPSPGPLELANPESSSNCRSTRLGSLGASTPVTLRPPASSRKQQRAAKWSQASEPESRYAYAELVEPESAESQGDLMSLEEPARERSASGCGSAAKLERCTPSDWVQVEL